MNAPTLRILADSAAAMSAGSRLLPEIMAELDDVTARIWTLLSLSDPSDADDQDRHMLERRQARLRGELETWFLDRGVSLTALVETVERASC